MKNKTKILWVIVVMIIGAMVGYIQTNRTSTQMSSLLLENIEALAEGENIKTLCIGIGSVDCPYNKTKVYIVREGSN